MKASHVLSVTRREQTGSRYARRYRGQGLLPAVLYGQSREPVALNLDAKEALRFFQLGEKVFTIAMKGESASQTVLLKDIQYDYLGSQVVHVDLERVDLDQEIESHVPVHFVGEAKGANTAGAIVTHPITSLTVRCAVRDLPEYINVDVSDLDVGGTITIASLKLPEGVKVLDDPSAVVAAVERILETETTAEAATGAAGSEPEVITAKKEKPEA